MNGAHMLLVRPGTSLQAIQGGTFGGNFPGEHFAPEKKAHKLKIREEKFAYMGTKNAENNFKTVLQNGVFCETVCGNFLFHNIREDYFGKRFGTIFFAFFFLCVLGL